MVKNLKIFFCTSLDAQKSLLFPMSRRFCRQFLPHQILAVWQNAVPVSCDRAPAGGFLVRRLQVFFTGSKGRTVKARAAARRGSLDRLPAFGIPAGATDGEARDTDIQPTQDDLPCTDKSRIQQVRRESHVFDYRYSHVAY